MKKPERTKNTGLTVGEEACRLLQSPEEVNPIDLQRAMHAGNTSKDSFESQILEALNRGRKEIWGSFFIVVLLKKEKLLPNVMRQYFVPRKSCPTPQYDQIVYRYDAEKEGLEFLWVVPDPASCKLIHGRGAILPLEQQPLVQYVKDFFCGELDKKCALLNGETPEIVLSK